MLSFTTALETALSKSATQTYWLLRLYYNDESNFTGISDRTRTVGTDIYYGIASWGTHNQTLHIDKFRTSNGTMQVKLNNSPNTIDGGRFSDLLADNNYANRKWALYQCAEGVTFSTDNQIAGGIISSDFEHSGTSTSIYLNDYWAKYDIELPLNRVTKALYSNAPEKNIGEPVPIMMGDFDVQDDVPASSDFERYYTKGKVPAIIVDKGDSSGYIHCLPDTDKVDAVILKQLNAKNVFMLNQVFQACDDSNVDLTAAPSAKAHNLIKITGTDFYAYVPFARDLTTGLATITNQANMFDEDFTTSGNMSCTAGGTQDMDVEIGDVKHTGQATNIEVLAYFGTFTGDPDSGGGGGLACFYVLKTGANVFFTWDGDSYQKLDMGSFFDDVNMEGMTLAGKSMSLFIDDSNNNGGGDVDIKELGIQIKLTADKVYTHQIMVWKSKSMGLGQLPRIWKESVEMNLPETDVLFISGKGRQYGDWITDRGFTSGNLNDQPTYQIEEILRNEVGIGSMVDTTSFDVSGNPSTGDIENAFNCETSAIKFAFSQPKLIYTKPLIEKICSQCGSYVWWSGDSIKLKTRRRTYASVNSTIDFKHIKNPTFDLTPMSDVYNHITVNYNYDYNANKTIKVSTPTDNASQEDSTSQGTTVNGYGQVLKLTADMPFTLDQTTAENYGDALLAWYKDRKQIITFDTTKATYNDLEVGDIINFSNWDSNLKVFGDTISTADGFMITQITKRPNGAKIQVTEVAGTIS